MQSCFISETKSYLINGATSFSKKLDSCKHGKTFARPWENDTYHLIVIPLCPVPYVPYNVQTRINIFLSYNGPGGISVSRWHISSFILFSKILNNAE